MRTLLSALRPLGTYAVLVASFAHCGAAQEGNTATLHGTADDVGGATAPAPPAPINPSEEFATFSQTFLDQLLALSPVWATAQGDHRFDDRWPDVSAQGDATLETWLDIKRQRLLSIDRGGLDTQARVDSEILLNRIDYLLLELREIKETTWNPIVYTRLIGDGIDPLITRTFAPWPERARLLTARLNSVGPVLMAARTRILRAPKPHVETAIGQTKGLIAVCLADIPSAATQDPTSEVALKTASDQAARELKAFLVFLEEHLLPSADQNFRLGRTLFDRKLQLELDATINPLVLVESARKLLADTQGEMFDTALELSRADRTLVPPKKRSREADVAFIKKALQRAAEDRPTNASILKEASDLVASTTRFAREKNLVRIPDDPVSVVEMPEYRRGTSVAYCDSTGPLEKQQETAYAISPTPKEWSKARALSFYREYNRAMLAELTIHEAVPGHYLQIMHNNAFPSKVRAIFSNGAFVEGWAVYAEWLMSHHGYGGPAVRLQRQKMVLRLATNAILDASIHAGNMSEAEAIDLMMNQAFQEEGEAHGKWRRAQITSAQLTTYHYGFSQMIALRRAHESAPGFSERAYHDRLLSFGSPPLRHLQSLL